MKPFFKDRTIVVMVASDILLENRFSNSIRVYGENKIVIQILKLVDKFVLICKLTDFVQIFFEKWMTISFLDNW